MPSRRAALPLALLALLLVPPAACATPEWVAPINFPVPGSDTFEGKPVAQDQVVYQDGGVADEAFLQIGSLAPLQTKLHIGTMPPGGSYSDQLTVASGEGAYPVSAQIAVAADGAAVAAWAELTGPSLETSPYRYRAAYRPAGSATWETPFTIALDTERQKGVFQYLTPAISANGTAAVGVQHIAGGEHGASQGEPVYRIDVAVHPPAGTWSAQRISPPNESAEGLGLGFDAGGDLTAAYAQRFSEGPTPSPEDDRYTLIARRRPAASGVWGPEENITGSEIQWTVDAQHLAVNEAGDAVLAYQYVGPKSLGAWAVTRVGTNSSWSPPTHIVSGGAGAAPEAAGVAHNGTSYVLYSFQGNSSGEDCEGVVRAGLSGAFTGERCVSPTNEDAFSGSIAFLGDDAYFAWRSNPPGEASSFTVQGARWLIDPIFPDVTHNLDQTGPRYGPPTLVEDLQGSVVAFYEHETQIAGRGLRRRPADSAQRRRAGKRGCGTAGCLLGLVRRSVVGARRRPADVELQRWHRASGRCERGPHVRGSRCVHDHAERHRRARQRDEQHLLDRGAARPGGQSHAAAATPGHAQPAVLPEEALEEGLPPPPRIDRRVAHAERDRQRRVSIQHHRERAGRGVPHAGPPRLQPERRPLPQDLAGASGHVVRRGAGERHELVAEAAEAEAGPLHDPGARHRPGGGTSATASVTVRLR